jgi:aspartate/methionine/tyrosine aminotransferase
MRTDPIVSNWPDTVFDIMSGLARTHNAINLGQGFPDTQGPEELRCLAGEALLTGSNQYPPMRGLPNLREAAARHYKTHQGLDLEARDVLVTSGATEALAATLLALLHPDDEVLVLDPAYDAYRPLIARAGRRARSFALQPPHWHLDVPALEAALTPNTRAILFNNPMNPAARAFSLPEVQALSALCQKHDLIAICDEVWEHVIFDQHQHVSVLGQSGMAERTVKIGSAGKMFSMTGWKVGFVVAAPGLLDPIAKAHQYLTFTTPPALQEAIAHGLDWDRAWFTAQQQSFQRSRDRLAAALTQEGFAVLPSEATYFLCVDLPTSGIAQDPWTFAKAAVTQFGVATIPLTSFYQDPATAPPVIRLCFAKADATLDAGVERLAQAKRSLCA